MKADIEVQLRYKTSAELKLKIEISSFQFGITKEKAFSNPKSSVIPGAVIGNMQLRVENYSRYKITLAVKCLGCVKIGEKWK